MAGVYIASGPWLPEDTRKVGCSGRLAGRLKDAAYTTCWPADHWHFDATYRTKSKREAERLEAGVLIRTTAHRPWDNELVVMPLDELKAHVEEAARLLEISAAEAAPPAPAAERRTATKAAAPPLLTPDEVARLRPAAVAPKPTVKVEASEPKPVKTGSAPAPAPLPPKPIDIDPLPTEDDEDREESYEDVLENTRVADAPAPPPVEVRAYQVEAAKAAQRELATDARATVLQMACRSGKTMTAWRAMAGILTDEDGGLVMMLVPGLALLRQTAAKLCHYDPGLANKMLLVGSCAGATTDADEVARVVAAGARVVLSTYHSSALLAPYVATAALVVFDECHRTCGAAPRRFNETLRAAAADDVPRLSLTATPRYDGTLNMRDLDVFGGIAYRYHMRRGIDDGHIVPFALRFAEGETVAAQVLAALGVLEEAAPDGCGRLLVFCRSIKAALELQSEAQALHAQHVAGESPLFLAAHSRMKTADVAATLRAFAGATKSTVLFNCRLFQEGVEIPSLQGVFFAAPRRAARDIIQSICRPLTPFPGKGEAAIFLPAPADTGLKTKGPYDTVVPFVDALLDEDPALYDELLTLAPRILRHMSAEHLKGLVAAVKGDKDGRAGRRLLRPERLPWDVCLAEMKRVIEVCGRYPKGKDAVLIAGSSAEQKIKVYASLHAWWQWCADEYVKPAAESKLAVWQREELAALPEWERYGLKGPYPTEECFATLEKWLVDHDGQPPPVEINKGGWIGLDATPLERLSGFLTTINQQDGRDRKRGGVVAAGSGFTISSEKQAELERICAPHGLRWRKQRDPVTGALAVDEKGDYSGPPTFVQEGFAEFKRRFAAIEEHAEWLEEHFPGYPKKHAHQELISVYEKKLMPPRIDKV